MSFPSLPASGAVDRRVATIGRMAAGNLQSADHFSAPFNPAAIALVLTATVSGSGDGTAYTLRLQTDDPAVDRTVSYVGGASDAATADALFAALVADPSLGIAWSFSQPTTTTVTLTRRQPGRTGTAISSAGAIAIATTTAAAANPAAIIGRALRRVAPAAGQPLNASEDAVDLLPAIAGPVVTLTFGWAASTDFSVLVLGTVLGGSVQNYAIAVGAPASAAALVTAIEAADGLPPGSTIEAEASANDVAVTIGLPLGFAIAGDPEADADGDGTVEDEPSVEAGGAVPEIVYCRLDEGVAPLPTAPGAAPSYLTTLPGGRAIPVAALGDGSHEYGVESAPDAAYGGQVYVEHAAGADRGRFVASPSPTAAPWLGATWRQIGASTSTISI